MQPMKAMRDNCRCRRVKERNSVSESARDEPISNASCVNFSKKAQWQVSAKEWTARKVEESEDIKRRARQRGASKGEGKSSRGKQGRKRQQRQC
eukprot:6209972-Pleurochrysis_carterae.AAC.2